MARGQADGLYDKESNNFMKKFITTFLALILSLSMIMGVFAAEGKWMPDDVGIWYQYDDGTYPAGEWVLIDY